MDTVVQSAAAESGWVAALLVLLVLSGFGVLGYIVRQLWTDHRALQEFVRTTMADLLTRNTTAFGQLTQELHARPCQREREPRKPYLFPDPDAPIARGLQIVECPQ